MAILVIFFSKKMDDDDAVVMESPPAFAKKTKRKKHDWKHDWSEEDIHKLIGEVECHPCIWNASSADYHNKPMRDNAWTEIGGMLNIRTEEVCTKWSNLRIQYRGYLNKKTKSGQGADNAPKWKYFDSMAFIGRAELSQRQPTTTNLNIPSESEEAALSSAPSSNMTTTNVMATFCDVVQTIKDRRKSLNPNEEFGRYMVSELNALNDDDAANIRRSLGGFLFKELSVLKQKENAAPEFQQNLNQLLK